VAPDGGERVGAIPSDLIRWSVWARGRSADLQRSARRLNQAILDLNRSRPDASILRQVACAGNDVIGYAVRNDSTDAWVGRVGRAFLSAATRDLPIGVARANAGDLARGLVTVDQGTIASLVGADPVDEAERIRMATELAEEVWQAIHAGRTGRLRQLVRQLDYGRDPRHPEDRTFERAFFEDLGPDGVGMLMTFSSVFDDDRLLELFDESLASATMDPGWDPDFNRQLFPEPGEGWRVYPGMVRLLKYGDYSEDLLTRAGDNILLGGTDRRNAPIDLEDGVSAARIVLEALSRNPEASLHYLLGHALLPGFGTAPDTRNEELMGLFRSLFDEHPHLAGAMGDVISAAARASDARSVIRGPHGDEPQIQALFRMLGKEHGYLSTSRDLRRGIARAIGEQLDLFRDVEASVGWTWQKRVFWEAETDGRGHVIQQSVDAVREAAAKWTARHIPLEYDRDDADLRLRWREWAGGVGSIYGLLALPERVAGYDEERIREEQARFWSMAVERISVPIPKDEEALELLAKAGKKVGIGLLEHLFAPGDPDGEAARIFDREQPDMLRAIALLYLSQHPSLVPHGQDPVELARRVAGDEPFHDTDLLDLEAVLDHVRARFDPEYFEHGVQGHA